MAQEPERGRSRGRDYDDDRYTQQDRRGEYGRGQESMGYGRGREGGYESDYGRGQGEQSQRGYGQYARDEGEQSGYGGDYGRWQEGQSYGRGHGKDRSEQFGSDYGPRGRFRDQGYGQRPGSEEWYGGAGNRGGYGSQTQSGGSYDENYNEMYGRGRGQDSGGQRPGGQYQSGQSRWAEGGQMGAIGGQSGQYGGQGMGQHRGKGPKNYSRSDDRIREEVCDRLTDDAHVDASEIDITVKDGEVTLTGTVDSRDAKRRAEDAIENCSGVKHVQNNLRVKQQGSSPMSGGEMAGSSGRMGTASTSSSSGAAGGNTSSGNTGKAQTSQQNLGSPKTA
jgi:osmotically-inducible protein OsmY